MTLLQNARLPLRHRNFRYLFAAQAISLIGTGLSPVAWALGVLELTKSNSDLGITLGAASIPTVVMLLIGGVWADRLPRHQVVATANIACCVTQLALGCMLLLGKFSLLLAIALQLVFGSEGLLFSRVDWTYGRCRAPRGSAAGECVAFLREKR